MAALGKALIDLAPSDIQSLIDGEWIEDEILEFKSTLSHSGSGNPDKWLVDQSEIGQSSKRDVFAEVVAMANSYGGDVVLGIDESDEKPHRAIGITQLPKCVDLASRFEHAARDLIKPQIPMLKVRGIPIDGESGVVVFRVPRSRSAPHRLEMSGIVKECYRRVDDRSEPMTMREIQDLTFAVARGLQRLDETLSANGDEFQSWVKETSALHIGRWGYAVIATPMSSDIFLEKVHRNVLVTPTSQAFKVKTKENGKWFDFQGFQVPYDWRPILRGTQASYVSPGRFSIIRRLACDGSTLEFNKYVVDPTAVPQQEGFYFYPDWIFTSVLNCFETLDRFRSAIGAHSVDYAMDLIVWGSQTISVRRIGDLGFHDALGAFPAKAMKLPRYQIGGKDTWHESLRLIWHDFFDAIGFDASADAPSVQGW